MFPRSMLGTFMLIHNLQNIGPMVREILESRGCDQGDYEKTNSVPIISFN
jgi:hypothetical protein